MSNFFRVLMLTWLVSINPAFATAPIKELGQLFFVSLEKNYTPQDLELLIKDYCPGGFVLFKRNLPTLQATAKITANIRTLSRKHCNAEPFLALDQEGGSVSRLPLSYKMPSAMAIGLSQDEALAYEYGALVGAQLRSLGFNINFAPVLDVASGGAGDFISTRSFSSNPDIVAKMGLSYSRGLISAGVYPTAKHFPGIGDAKQDLHKTAASNPEEWKELLSSRLKPFSVFSQLGPMSLVMTSHLSFPELDKSGLPSGFSRVITTELLKEFLGFKGLVITDDLEMGGAHVFDNPESGLVKAFYAGSDMLVFSHFGNEQRALFQQFKKIFSSKVLDVAVLKGRIEKVKSFKAAMASPPVRALASQNKQDLSEEFGLLNQRLLRKILKSQVARLPKKMNRLVVFSTDNRFAHDLGEDFAGEVVSIHFDEAKGWNKATKISSDDVLILPIFKRSDLRQAVRLPKSLLAQINAFNFSAPVEDSHSKKFASFINVYFSEKKTGQELARIINEIDN